MINRCAVTVRAKQPFLDWLEGLPDMLDLSLEEINTRSTAYLLPFVDDLGTQTDLLEEFFLDIFEEEIAGWWTVQDDWPDTSDFDLFRSWFQVEFHSMVMDLVEEQPLVVE